METSLPLALTKLKHLCYQIIAKMSFIPAEILKIDCGTLSIGAVGDVTLIDPNLSKIVDPSTFASKSKSPLRLGINGLACSYNQARKLVWSSDQINFELDTNKN